MTLAENWVDGIGMEVDADYLNDVGGDVNALSFARTLYGARSARPTAAAGNSGARYECTDCNAEYLSDGSAWSKIRIGGAAGPPMADPPSSSLSTTTLGSATFVADKDARLLTIPSAGGDNWRVEYKALSPTSNYTATAYIEQHVVNADHFLSGLVLYDSASGKLINFGLCHSTPIVSAGFFLGVLKFTNVNTFSAAYVGKVIGTQIPAMPNWLRIKDDGTNRLCQYSFNGVEWFTLHAIGRTDFLTPNSIGWGADNSGGSTAYVRNRSLVVA